MKTMILKPIETVGKYLMLMGRTLSRPERMRMFFKQYLNEMVQLGINSIHCAFNTVHDLLCILRTNNNTVAAKNTLVFYNMSLIPRKTDSFYGAMTDTLMAVFTVRFF